jgi:low temperature requirement protein LtrA
VFFGIWWAWMNFSWFASAYDTDDVPYRLAVLVQMTGVLIYAAGIPRVFIIRTSASPSPGTW